MQSIELDRDLVIELGALAAYLAVLLWIGVRSARQSRTSLDFTLAGRSIPWPVVMATTAATMIGGGASIGMVGRVYQIGIAAALITVAWHIQLVFMGLFVAPRLRRLNLITVGDFFELKFGELARLLAIVNCLIFLMGALAAQMAALGTIANNILGVPYEVALVIGAAVTIFYSTIGGIRAVVKTDVLQFVILVGGIAIAATVLLVKNGGFAAIAEKIPEGHFQLTSTWSTTYLVSMFLAFLLGEMFVPPYTVRCFIARDAQQARWGVAGAGAFLLLFMPVATFVLGVSARADPEVRQAVESDQGAEKRSPKDKEQQAFPELVRRTFRPIHPAISGVMVAALIAAVMSSADSCLASLAPVVMEDMYRRHINPRANDRTLLRVAQGSTLVTGVAACCFAYVNRNIADLLVFVYDFWAPAMVLPFLVGLFWYKPSRIYAVVASMVAGMMTTAVWRFAVLHRIADDSPWKVGTAVVALAVAIAVFLVALPLTRRLPLGSFFQPLDSIEPIAAEDKDEG